MILGPAVFTPARSEGAGWARSEGAGETALCPPLPAPHTYYSFELPASPHGHLAISVLNKLSLRINICFEKFVCVSDSILTLWSFGKYICHSHCWGALTKDGWLSRASTNWNFLQEVECQPLLPPHTNVRAHVSAHTPRLPRLPLSPLCPV